MGQQSQQRCARAQTGSEEDEERKLLFGVDRELMEGWKQFSVSTLSARRVWEEQMTLLSRKRNNFEGAFPSVQQKIQSSAHIFPVTKVEEGVLKMKIL